MFSSAAESDSTSIGNPMPVQLPRTKPALLQFTAVANIRVVIAYRLELLLANAMTKVRLANHHSSNIALEAAT